VQNFLVDLAISQYLLVFFETKAPQPLFHIHNGVPATLPLGGGA
jgi:hypothetical protein